MKIKMNVLFAGLLPVLVLLVPIALRRILVKVLILLEMGVLMILLIIILKWRRRFLLLLLIVELLSCSFLLFVK